MKQVSVECNFNYLGGSFPAVSHGEVKSLNLKINEKVIAFQQGDEEDLWEGVVKFDPSLPEIYQWYIELL